MSLFVKQSQLQSSHLDGIMVRPEDLPHLLKDVGELRLDINIEPEDSTEEEALANGGEVTGEVTIEIEDGEPLHKDFAFTLPKVPGGDDQEEIEEPTEIEVEEPEEDVEVISDPWKWKLDSFMDWLQNKWSNIPKHTGRDTAGIERAIAYLEALDREISKAVRMDVDSVLEIGNIESIRDEIHDGVKRLKERHDKVHSTKYPGKNKKKKAEFENGIVKEAGTAKINDITITVPLLISSLARSMINSTVSNGKDIEDTFKKLAKEYDLTKREKLELIQLVSDMGFYIRKDLGMPLDHIVDTISTDNVNFSANYPG